MLDRSLFQKKPFWVAVAAGALVLALLLVWAIRSYQRAQVRNLLNEHPAFQNPPLAVSFPRLLPEDAPVSEVLEPGVSLGLWTLRRRAGEPPAWEVRLSERGLRWFSQVGNQIVATFRLGTRQVIRVTSLGGNYPSRSVRFQYVWKAAHPAVGVLGEAAPQIGQVYEGDALLFYEQDRWKVMHWSTPELDQAVARFRALGLPPSDVFSENPAEDSATRPLSVK
ncbi:MAG: hypothetical protein HY647_10030 [Acidobacteria bacterium]|nr:hypothetical protein [Acidobacteriota bacterium]